MDMNCHEVLEQKMCKELEQLEAKYATNLGQPMSEKDLDTIDKLYHALKSLATYKAMKEAEEYDEEGMSGRRGRAMNGRYVSRDPGYSMYGNGYDDGYSGHYPMYPPRRGW